MLVTKAKLVDSKQSATLAVRQVQLHWRNTWFLILRDLAFVQIVFSGLDPRISALRTRRTDRRRYEDDHDGGRDPRPHQDGRQRRHQKE